jgi:hypothetical protein
VTEKSVYIGCYERSPIYMGSISVLTRIEISVWTGKSVSTDFYENHKNKKCSVFGVKFVFLKFESKNYRSLGFF